MIDETYPKLHELLRPLSQEDIDTALCAWTVSYTHLDVYKRQDQFERHVKKGEHGITIIAPTPYKKKIEEQKLDPDTCLLYTSLGKYDVCPWCSNHCRVQTYHNAL